MCISCGCGQPNERHGTDDNITRDDLERAARAADLSLQDVSKNIATGLQGA